MPGTWQSRARKAMHAQKAVRMSAEGDHAFAFLSTSGGAAQSSAMRVHVRLPAPYVRTLGIDADGSDFLQTLQAKVNAQCGIHPDTIRFRHNGHLLLGNLQLRDYNLPEDPVLDLEVHFLVDVVEPSQPSRAAYARLRKDSWGRSRLLAVSRAQTPEPVSRGVGRAAHRTCAKCGVERAPELEISWFLQQQGTTPCTRDTTFRPKSRVNHACTNCGNEASDHYRAGRRQLCYDAEKFAEKGAGRLLTAEMLHEPDPPPGTCRRCGHHEHDHQSAARYCFQKQHWLCCVCRELDGQLSCQPCQSRVQAIRALERELDLALHGDRFKDAMAAVTKARHQAGPSFYAELDEVWKLGLGMPSGIAYLASAEGAQYIRNGVLDASYSEGWGGSARRIQCCFDKHMRTICGDIEKLSPRITELRICNNPYLSRLPVHELCRMRSLQILSCLNCPNLLMPPPEVVSQGGDVTMRFMRDAAMHGGVDERCALFTIGEFASGKTSVINALVSTMQQGSAADEAHHEENATEDRAQVCTPSSTLGFENRAWVPAGEDMKFEIFDLGGHPTLCRLNQLLFAKRAVYLLAWRARRLGVSGNIGFAHQNDTVLDCLDDLRHLVPGAAVILVVTHIDCVTDRELEEQCMSLQSAVHSWIRKCPSSLIEICLDAQSIRLDGRSGAGASVLRTALLKEVRERNWFRQPLSSSWAWFTQEITKLSNEGSTLAFQWAEYVKLARLCGIAAHEFQSVTVFLRDTARIRYFDLALLNSVADMPEEALDDEDDVLESSIPRQRASRNLVDGSIPNAFGQKNVKQLPRLGPLARTNERTGELSLLNHEPSKSELKADEEREQLERESIIARASFESAMKAMAKQGKQEQDVHKDEEDGDDTSDSDVQEGFIPRQQSFRNLPDASTPNAFGHQNIKHFPKNGSGSGDEESGEAEEEEEDEGENAEKEEATQEEGNRRSGATKKTFGQDTPLPLFQKIRDRKEKMKTFRSGWSTSSSQPASDGSVLHILHESAPQVYVSFKKMSSILRGLFRQNRHDLLKHFARLKDAEGLTMVCRLHVHGILDPALLPYLWPRIDSSYWEIAGGGEAYSEEVRLWGRPFPDDPSDRRVIRHPERLFEHVITSLEDEKQMFQFLQEFNVMARRSSGDLVVWDLTAPHFQNVIDARATTTKDCPCWMSITVPSFPRAFFAGLSMRLLRDHDHGDISSTSAQFFVKGKKTQLIVSGTSAGYSCLTIRSSHASSMAKVRDALSRHVQLFPGLTAQIQHRTMPEIELKKCEPASILVASNLLLGRYESISEPRPRDVLNSLLSHKIAHLAASSKAEMECIRAEEACKGQDSAVLAAKESFLGFEKCRGKSGSVHIDHEHATITTQGFSTIVANEYCRIGEMGYYELEILEEGELFVGFVTTEFERTHGRCDLGIGDDTHSWCVSSSSWRCHAGHRTAFGSPWKRGDVIGLACDLKLGLLHVSVNGSFEAPNGVACSLSLAPHGLYPALSARSGKVKYNLTIPFMYPPPLIPVKNDANTPWEAREQEEDQPRYMSMWECRVKDAEKWKEPHNMAQARKNAERKRMTAQVVSKFSQLCPIEYSLEMHFPDSHVRTTPRIVVVIVDDEVCKTREGFREEIEAGFISPWPTAPQSIKDKFQRKVRAHLNRLMPLRTWLATVRDTCPGCVFIPVLLPGWDSHLHDAEDDVFDWWPEGPCSLRQHPLAIQLLQEEDPWWDSIQDKLLPTISKHLTAWRGEESPMLEAICCPTCLRTGNGAAPFCFDRNVCSRQMKFPIGRGTFRHHMQQCPICHKAKREPHTFELVKPEVYISHCVDSQSPLKALIAAIFESVESNLDCMCWPPLKKAATFLKTDVEDNNRRRIGNSKTVIICLSDRYLRSERCLAEFREAIVQRRFIIPILLPDMGLIESRTPSREHAKHGRTNISSGGWQGSRSPTDWWQHPAIARIYDTASDKASARNGDHALSAPRAAASARDGSSLHQRDLSRFAPISIEVQEKLGGYSGPSSNTQEVLLDEVTEALIIARILETIHVPQLPDHNPR